MQHQTKDRKEGINGREGRPICTRKETKTLKGDEEETYEREFQEKEKLEDKTPDERGKGGDESRERGKI